MPSNSGSGARGFGVTAKRPARTAMSAEEARVLESNLQQAWDQYQQTNNPGDLAAVDPICDKLEPYALEGRHAPTIDLIGIVLSALNRINPDPKRSERAIASFRAATEAAATNVERAIYLTHLANAISEKPSVSAKDSEDGLQIQEEALSLLDPDDANRPVVLASLGRRYRDRYSQTEQLEYLDKAIDKFGEALS